MKIKILIPVYNDWQSVTKLISEIDDLVKNINHEISIISYVYEFFTICDFINLSIFILDILVFL